MKKILITILMVALLISTAQAANRFGDTYHAVQVKDETGRNVTDITNLFIYLPGTTTDATIYADKNRQNTITIPMTEASTNTTLIDGLFTWWGPDKYDFSMTNDDGVGPMTNSGHADRDSGGGTLVFPTYLVSITTSSFLDAETLTMGTGADWVFQAGNVSNQLSFTPAADDSTVNFGVSGTDKNTNFNVFVGASLGFKLSSAGATHSMTYDGGIVNLNPSSNFAVNIATGTSTGATTIGNSAGGAIALDTDTGITVNADDSYALTVTAGTIGITATGGDITVDATDKSLILRGSEAVANSILIDADVGSIDIDSADNITVDAADDITYTTADGTYTVAAGGASNGDIVLGAANDVDIDAADDVTVDTADGGITLTAAGGTLGDITLVSADDTIITSSGKVTITNTEALTISGLTTLTGAATATLGLQNAAVARAANTAHGGGTSIIAPGTAYVDVTSTNADFIIVLPATVVGNVITLVVGSNGFELQTPDASSPTINEVDCSGGDTNEAPIPADSICTLTAIAANEWSLVVHAATGAHTGAITPNGV